MPNSPVTIPKPAVTIDRNTQFEKPVTMKAADAAIAAQVVNRANEVQRIARGLPAQSHAAFGHQRAYLGKAGRLLP